MNNDEVFIPDISELAKLREVRCKRLIEGIVDKIYYANEVDKTEINIRICDVDKNYDKVRQLFENKGYIVNRLISLHSDDTNVSIQWS